MFQTACSFCQTKFNIVIKSCLYSRFRLSQNSFVALNVVTRFGITQKYGAMPSLSRAAREGRLVIILTENIS